MQDQLNYNNRNKNSLKRKTLLDIYHLDTWSVSKEQFKAITKLLGEKLLEALLIKGQSIKLPRQLGTIMIRKRKTGIKKVIDFYNTKKYGVRMFHNNWHSEGYYVFLNWDKDFPVASFANKKLYEMKLVRAKKRYLAKLIKENNSIANYLEIE